MPITANVVAVVAIIAGLAGVWLTNRSQRALIHDRYLRDHRTETYLQLLKAVHIRQLMADEAFTLPQGQPSLLQPLPSGPTRQSSISARASWGSRHRTSTTSGLCLICHSRAGRSDERPATGTQHSARADPGCGEPARFWKRKVQVAQGTQRSRQPGTRRAGLQASAPLAATLLDSRGPDARTHQGVGNR
jgi:hypothetical protein